MQPITVQIAFGSTKKHIAGTLLDLNREICRQFLNRQPTKIDLEKFTSRFNPQNSSITDLYFAGKKYGSLSTSFILDGTRGIVFQFTPGEMEIAIQNEKS